MSRKRGGPLGPPPRPRTTSPRLPALPAAVAAAMLGLLAEAPAAPGEAANPAAAASQSSPAADFAGARGQARASGRLVLLEIGATWCSGCKLFARDAASVAALQGELGGVVFLSVDGEKGEGPALVKRFRVAGYPTFLLTDAAGQPVDRWLGYEGAGSFIARLRAALADPLTIEEKVLRQARAPSAPGAAQLAAIRIAEARYAEAVALYGQARALAPQTPGGYAREIFAATDAGFTAAKPGFTADSLRAAADLVLASTPRDPGLLLHVASTMRALGARAREPEIAAPYLAAAIEATAGSRDSLLLQQRAALLPDHALYVEHDLGNAARLKRAAMPPGWQSDPARINEYAWWCLRHDVDLEVAEAITRQGVAAAASGREKAMLLDTLAEIRARLGDARAAAALCEQAAREAPENPYYLRQAARFRTAAGAKP